MEEKQVPKFLYNIKRTSLNILPKGSEKKTTNRENYFREMNLSTPRSLSIYFIPLR